MQIKKESLGLQHDLLTHLLEDLVKRHFLFRYIDIFQLFSSLYVGVVGLSRSLMFLHPSRILPVTFLKQMNLPDQIPHLSLTFTLTLNTTFPFLILHDQ